MFRKTMLLAIVLNALAILPCVAESVEGLPLHVQKIEPGVVRVWVGDHVSSTAVSAIATRKGIVVIDSTNIPRLDEAFRKVIAKELGRSDFKYLINPTATVITPAATACTPIAGSSPTKPLRR